MTITYKTNVSIRAEQAAEVFVHSGIKRPAQDLDRIQRMLDHASLTVTAWKDSELIGIARALTDFSYCCYLSDLAVVKTIKIKESAHSSSSTFNQKSVKKPRSFYFPLLLL